MALEIGIVGLPNVGKSTLFNALASKRLAETAPRPFTTIDPHEAIVPLPDTNLDLLSKMIKPEVTSPATISFIDIAGLIKGAHKGEGLGNHFLAKIREVDMIAHVVRAFVDPLVPHPHMDHVPGTIEQIIDDIEVVNIELELGGIVDKPTIYVLNVDEKNINDTSLIKEVELKFKEKAINISSKMEEELMDFTIDEKGEYLKEMGISKSSLELLILYSYQLLDLISFYTVKGGKEIHARSIKKGSNIIQAAQKVHSDFAKKFIKAEVIEVEDLLSSGGWKSAKDRGIIRLEGKDYIVKDKDVIEFKVGA